MKFLLVYRIAFITALVVISPFFSIASDGSIDKPLRREIAESVLSLFQDSIPPKKKADTKQPARQTPPQDVRDVRIKDRAIKQVPRSVPKLKPQPVSDKVKVRGRH
jgi:hypothetical protein